MAFMGVNLGMSLSVLFFVIGYFFRKSNNARHRLFMALGVLANLATAVLLLGAIYIFADGNMETAGFYPRAAPWIILTHRVLAVLALLNMLAMVWTGITRRRDLHILLHRPFIPLYGVVYVSGLLVFGGSPA